MDIDALIEQVAREAQRRVRPVPDRPGFQMIENREQLGDWLKLPGEEHASFVMILTPLTLQDFEQHEHLRASTFLNGAYRSLLQKAGKTPESPSEPESAPETTQPLPEDLRAM
jgi:hypothetical protein